MELTVGPYSESGQEMEAFRITLLPPFQHVELAMLLQLGRLCRSFASIKEKFQFSLSFEVGIFKLSDPFSLPYTVYLT